MIIILLSFSSCHAPDEVVVMHVLPLAPAVSHKGGRLGYIISCEGSVDRLSGGVVCAIYICVCCGGVGVDVAVYAVADDIHALVMVILCLYRYVFILCL